MFKIAGNLLIAIALLFVINCGGSGSMDEAEDNTGYSESVTSFSGSGDDLTDTFYCYECQAVFETSHNGTSSFMVSLLNDSNETVAVVGYGGGEYEDKTTKSLSSGYYKFDVEASGSWSVSITGKCDNIETTSNDNTDGFGEIASLK